MDLVFCSCSCIWHFRGEFLPTHLNVDGLDTNENICRTFCDTTMYLYVSEIFPTEIRPIGMGFSLFGQFACKLTSYVC